MVTLFESDLMTADDDLDELDECIGPMNQRIGKVDAPADYLVRPCSTAST